MGEGDERGKDGTGRHEWKAAGEFSLEETFCQTDMHMLYVEQDIASLIS